MALWVWRFVEGEPPHFLSCTSLRQAKGVTKNKNHSPSAKSQPGRDVILHVRP